MSFRFLPLIVLALALSGCSTLKVVPVPVPGGTIDPQGTSLTLSRNGLAMTVANSNADLYSYNLSTGVTAFSVKVENRTPSEIAIGAESFILLDDQGGQHLHLTPDRVKEIVTKDSYYLIPYPYVGFYYLEDYEKVNAYQSFSAQSPPFYYEMYPQDLYTKALPTGGVIPGAQISGLVYFLIDISRVREMKLLYYGKGTSRSGAADFTFPFTVTK